MSDEKKSVLVRMPADLWEAARDASEIEDRTVSSFIREAIREKAARTMG